MDPDEAARHVRLAVLDAFWTGSGLSGTERQKHIGVAMDGAMAQVPEDLQSQIRERVIRELAAWRPERAEEIVPSPMAPVTAGHLSRALEAHIRNEQEKELSAEDRRARWWAVLLYEHVKATWSEQYEMIQSYIGGSTLKDHPVEYTSREFFTGDPPREGLERATSFAGELHDLLKRMNRVHLAHRAATVSALRSLIKELHPKNFFDSVGRGSARKAVEEALDEYECKHDQISGFEDEDLLRKYFNDPFKDHYRRKANR